LTRLSVNANGSLIPKDSVDKNLIKKSLWWAFFSLFFFLSKLY